jgi:hypothetical protein
MNVKNFIVGGIVGGIVNFLLGWVFYGMLLKDTFPQSGTENMTFIFLGCMSFGFLLSFIFSLSGGISKCMTGIKAASGIGLFLALYSNFFGNMTKAAIDYKLMAIDVVTTIVISALVGATIAVVNGKMK